MSEKLPQQPQNDEVDLGQLFNAIGKLFEKFFNFIGSIFKGVFSVIIYALKPFVKHFKIIAPIIVFAAILGYIYENYKKPVYYSEMLVKPYFDSKFQLSSNINYFNSLIASSNFEELSKVFKIDKIEAKELVSFELKPGPETVKDLTNEYNDYIKSIDTTLVEAISYKEFIENRDLLSSNIFYIKAQSFKADVFLNLERGFTNSFENSYSKRQKVIRDSIASIERRNLKIELSRLDSIQKTYLEVIKNQSENNNMSLSAGSLIPLQQEKVSTKEYELFLDEQRIRRALRVLEQKLAEENRFFDVLSRFDQIGKKETSIKRRYSIIFPLLTIVGILLSLFTIKAFKFIKDYE